MKGGLPMGFLDWAAVVLGVGLIVSGVRAVRRRRADVPEPREGVRAVGLGWLRVGLGVLFLVPRSSTSKP